MSMAISGKQERQLSQPSKLFYGNPPFISYPGLHPLVSLKATGLRKATRTCNAPGARGQNGIYLPGGVNNGPQHMKKFQTGMNPLWVTDGLANCHYDANN